MSLTIDQRKTILESLKQHGTLVMAAKTAGVSIDTIRTERHRSRFFDKQVLEALDTGKTLVGDNALTVIETIAFGKDSSEKCRLTAALSLCNAFSPGFKTQRVEGHIEHNVRVITAIPRPTYDPKQIVQGEVKLLPPVDQKRIARNVYKTEWARQYRAKQKVAAMSIKATPEANVSTLSIQSDAI